MADYKIICDECENEVPVNPNTLADERVEMHKLDKCEVLRLTYLQCPYCGKIYPVMLDDKRTLYYLGKLQRSKSERAMQQLKNTRFELARRWVNGVYTLAGKAYVFDWSPDREVFQ